MTSTSVNVALDDRCRCVLWLLLYICDVGIGLCAIKAILHFEFECFWAKYVFQWVCQIILLVKYTKAKTLQKPKLGMCTLSDQLKKYVLVQHVNIYDSSEEN